MSIISKHQIIKEINEMISLEKNVAKLIENKNVFLKTHKCFKYRIERNSKRR